LGYQASPSVNIAVDKGLIHPERLQFDGQVIEVNASKGVFFG
jgi:hypothetical protein